MVPPPTTLIIGGGAIGSAIACFLSSMPGGGEVVVVERDPSYRAASSSLSASSIRQQFSTPLNIELSQFGFAFMMDCAEGGVPGAAVGLTQSGYLFLGRPDQEEALRERTALARRMSVQVGEFDRAQLATAHPWMHTDDLSYAAFGLQGEGWFDGYLLQQVYRGRARAAGARYVQGDVAAVLCGGSRVAGVKLATGEEIAADRVVRAAGAWSAALGRTVGIELPVRARRRTAFCLSCPTPLPGLPVLIDTSGVYLRPEQRHFLAVLSPTAADDHDDLPLEPDLHQFEDAVWPLLAHRIPAFEALRVERAWAGYYEYNTADHNGLVGQFGPENFYVATGFSGHGLMHSAGVGRGMAELLCHGGYRTLDLSPLSPRRLETGRLIVERAVY